MKASLPWKISDCALLWRNNTKVYDPNKRDKNDLDKNDFRHSYGSFIGKQDSESYLITALLKVPSQELLATLKQHLERYPTV